MSAPDTERAGAPAVPRLDESQRAVLDLKPGQCAVVLGAPGTGKTTTLIELIAHRVLDLGGDPSHLLALTGSRAVATALRDRIGARLGLTTAGPLARTANSLAFDIVTRARRAEALAPPRLISGSEQDADVAALLAGHLDDGEGPDWPERLGAEVRGLRVFRTELRELLMRATERGISPSGLRRLGLEHDHPEWVAAADFFAEYRNVLAFSRADQFDSTELIALAIRLLDRGEPGELAAALRTVVVDDVQELSRSQLNLLAALARHGVGIVGFGDPDVATSAFRGAESRAVGDFGALIDQSVSTLTLSTVHRHGAALREFTGRIVERIGTSGVVGHRSAGIATERVERAVPGEPGVVGTPVVTVRATSQGRERAAVARLLREHHILRSVPFSRMGVIVRSGALVPGIARSLALASVPTRSTASDVALRDDAAARALLAVIDVGIGRTPLDAETAVDLLTGPFGRLDRLGLRRLRLALRAEEIAGGGSRPSDELLVEALAAPDRLVTIENHVARSAAALATQLAEVRDANAQGGTIEELLWLVWNGSGLAKEWLTESRGSGIAATEANRALDGVLALFAAAKRFVERDASRGAEVFLATVLDADVPEDTLAPQSLAETVLVTTPSGAVGLEFDVVVIAGLQDGVWPNLKPRGTLLAADEFARLVDGGAAGGSAGIAANRTDVLHDELRMFALAVSRARHQVVLSATSNEDETESVLLRLAPDAHAAPVTPVPPLTLRGLVGQLRRTLTSTAANEQNRAAAASGLAQLAVAEIPGADPDEWHGLAAPSTVTPLFAEADHVRVSPSTIEAFEHSPVDWFIDRVSGTQSSTAMGLGTIVHAAMELAPDSSFESVWKLIDERWSELLFEAPWLAEREKRAAQKIARGVAEYLGDFETHGKQLVGAERRFELDLPPAKLSGSIDRVERDSSGGVTIVDLKTGASKVTKAELVDHAQLRAYQLAYASGVLDEALAEFGDHHAAGAKLVYPRRARKKPPSEYDEAVQHALTADELERFRERVRSAARLMAATEFIGPLEVDEYRFGAAAKKLHRTPAVTSD